MVFRPAGRRYDGCMYANCPKCGHAPMPADQAFPATCPACGVILARVGRPAPVRTAVDRERDRERDLVDDDGDDEVAPRGLRARLLQVPDEVDPLAFWLRVAALSAFAAWGVVLARLDLTEGEINESFLHGPLLVFHEAGHVIFRPFGEWMTVAGGTLGQLLMPLVLAIALLWKNRDPFGASLGLWLLGVSLLDVAPYVYDAYDPKLMLLTGTTGETGPHDWMWLLADHGLRQHAQGIGRAVHAVGGAVVALALGWGAWVLARQWPRLDGESLRAR